MLTSLPTRSRLGDDVQRHQRPQQRSPSQPTLQHAQKIVLLRQDDVAAAEYHQFHHRHNHHHLQLAKHREAQAW
jgi:hypothetical protein